MGHLCCGLTFLLGRLNVLAAFQDIRPNSLNPRYVLFHYHWMLIQLWLWACYGYGPESGLFM